MAKKKLLAANEADTAGGNDESFEEQLRQNKEQAAVFLHNAINLLLQKQSRSEGEEEHLAFLSNQLTQLHASNMKNRFNYERKSERINLYVTKSLYMDVKTIMFYMKKSSINDAVVAVLEEKIAVLKEDPDYENTKQLIKELYK